LNGSEKTAGPEKRLRAFRWSRTAGAMLRAQNPREQPRGASSVLISKSN